MLIAAISLLALYSAVGMLIAAAVARPPTGPAFWRLTLLVAISAGGLGIGLRISPLGRSLPAIPMIAAGLLSVGAVGIVLFGVRTAVHPQRSHHAWLSTGTAAIVAGTLADPVLWPSTSDLGAAAAATFALGLVLTPLTLGSLLLAMILAHWYLIEPKLPLAPLQRVLLLFGAAVSLKAILLVVVVAIHWQEWSGAPGGLVRALVLGDALFVAVRAVLGVAAPLALVWMTWKTVEIRSIQSATGILYAAIVFVLFGDVISVYLSLATGQPF